MRWKYTALAILIVLSVCFVSSEPIVVLKNQSGFEITTGSVVINGNINLFVSLNDSDNLGYILYSFGRPENVPNFRFLCNPCFGGMNYTKNMRFSQGTGNIYIKYPDGTTIQKQIIVDSRAPIINNILPKQNKFVSRTFNITFSESNPKTVDFYYKGEEDSDFNIVSLNISACRKDFNKANLYSCSIDIPEIQQGSLLFYFNVSDNSFSKSSKIYNTTADITIPLLSIISPVQTTLIDRRFLLSLISSEQSKIYYEIDANGRVLTLCNNCIKATRTVQLLEGNHSIKIFVEDLAGNKGETKILNLAVL